MNVILDPSEFEPLIRQTIETFLARLRDEMSTAEHDRILLNKAEAATTLGMSQSTVDRLRRVAGLPCVKLNGKAMFRPEALREWAEGREGANNA